MRQNVPFFLAALVLLVPSAAAGSADAPELTDAAGDCSFAVGNEYLDVVSAWISDETATHFAVNLALAKWGPHEAVAYFTGATVQFQHQGEQFGVAAVYTPDGWDYSNGYIDLESGDGSDFSQAEGSFAPGEPAVLTVQFEKSNFPHTDASDNQLVNFQAGTVDFKSSAPGWFGSPASPPPQFCDIAEGAGTYRFQVGDHSAHDASTGADANATGDAGETTQPAADDAGASGATDGSIQPQAAPAGNETPGFAPALVALAVAVGVVALRRRA